MKWSDGRFFFTLALQLVLVFHLQCDVVMESPSIPAPAAPHVISFSVFSEVLQDCSWQQPNGQNAKTSKHLPDLCPAMFRLSAGIMWVFQAQSAAPVPTSRGRTQRSAEALSGCVCQGTVCHGAGGICQPFSVRTGFSQCQSVLRRGHLPWTRVSPDRS